MKTTIRLFSIILVFLCVTVSPTAQAVCQQGCVFPQCTVLGEDALSNPTRGDNTAIGYQALEFTTTGQYNTATGSFALLDNTTGVANTAIGYSALIGGNGSFNTAIGDYALFAHTAGDGNIAIGGSAGLYLTTGSYNIDIGSYGLAGDSNIIRIGRQGTQTAAFIAGIRGTPITGGIPVAVTSSGQLGVAPSSQRFKEAIRPMDKASEAILALQPVTFRYKKELDSHAISQFGLVAEQVEKVDPNLVVRDDQGKPYTVRYDAVNAMLLNEFLKEHRKVAEQEATITQLKAELQATATQQQKQIAALTAGLQKVSAQLELSKSVPRTVQNNQ